MNIQRHELQSTTTEHKVTTKHRAKNNRLDRHNNVPKQVVHDPSINPPEPLTGPSGCDL
ncbi:hypothetical protein Hanom_Chr13g01221951 [Helianthus anomalus]